MRINVPYEQSNGTLVSPFAFERQFAVGSIIELSTIGVKYQCSFVPHGRYIIRAAIFEVRGVIIEVESLDCPPI